MAAFMLSAPLEAGSLEPELVMVEACVEFDLPEETHFLEPESVSIVVSSVGSELSLTDSMKLFKGWSVVQWWLDISYCDIKSFFF